MGKYPVGTLYYSRDSGNWEVALFCETSIFQWRLLLRPVSQILRQQNAFTHPIPLELVAGLRIAPDGDASCYTAGTLKDDAIVVPEESRA